MDGLTVARADPADAAAVERMLDAAAEWQITRGIDQWRPGSFSDEIRQVIAAGDLYVANDDDEIVGCFMLEAACPGWMAPWLEKHGHHPSDAMYLGRLAVDRRASGHGLGLELLDAAGQLASDVGLGFLRLNVPSENQRLRRYYLDAGFTALGDAALTGPNGEPWVCSILERATRIEVVS